MAEGQEKAKGSQQKAEQPMPEDVLNEIAELEKRIEAVQMH